MHPINKEHEVFNDGILFLGTIIPVKDSANKVIEKNLNQYAKLFYKQLTKRDQDLQLANSLGSTLDLKVKTLKRDVSSRDKVKINDVCYDIFKYDSDEFYNYLYLQVIE